MDTAFLFIQAIQDGEKVIGFICTLRLDNRREHCGLLALHEVVKKFLDFTKAKPNIVLGVVHINYNPIESPIALEISVIGNSIEKLLLRIFMDIFYLLQRYSYLMEKPSAKLFKGNSTN